MTQLEDHVGVATTLISGFSYDSAGNRVSHTSPYGVVTSASFDALNRVVSLVSRGENGAAEEPLYAVSYTYDRAGNRRTSTEAIPQLPGVAEPREITWDYDGLYRLVTEEWSGDGTWPQTRSYAYDPAGNRLFRSVNTSAIGGGTLLTETQEYNDRNQIIHTATYDTELTEEVLDTWYSYDPNGNRIGKSSYGPGVPNVSISYAYDVANRLVSSNTGFHAYYDARTRRIGKSEGGVLTQFRYDGGTNFQELKPTGGWHVTTELIRAGGLGGGIGSVLYSDQTMAGGSWEGFLYNAVGHTTVLTDSSGTPTQQNLYEAFGQTILQFGSSTNNRLRNTKERDASIGLDNDGFRYYDPDTGTYVQRDPIGYADGLNVYHHVTNNPIGKFDPHGLSSEDETNRQEDAQKAAADLDRGLNDRNHALDSIQGHRKALKSGELSPEDAQSHRDALATDQTRLDATNQGIADAQRRWSEAGGKDLSFFGTRRYGQDVYTVGGKGLKGAMEVAKWNRIPNFGPTVTSTGDDVMVMSMVAGPFLAAGERLAVATPVRSNAELVQEIATRAEAWGVRHGTTNGSRMHKWAERILNRYQRMNGDRGLTAEARYLNGVKWDRGMGLKDTVRLDVVEGPLSNPTAVWDYKFGDATLTPSRIAEIRAGAGLSPNVPIHEMKP